VEENLGWEDSRLVIHTNCNKVDQIKIVGMEGHVECFGRDETT